MEPQGWLRSSNTPRTESMRLQSHPTSSEWVMMVEVFSWCPTALLFSENMGVGERERETRGWGGEGLGGGPFVNKGSFR